MAATAVLNDTFDGPAGSIDGRAPNFVLGGTATWFGGSPALALLGDGTVRAPATAASGGIEIGTGDLTGAIVVFETVIDMGVTPGGGEQKLYMRLSSLSAPLAEMDGEPYVQDLGGRMSLSYGSSYANVRIDTSSTTYYGPSIPDVVGTGVHTLRFEVDMAALTVKAYFDDELQASGDAKPFDVFEGFDLRPITLVMNLEVNDSRVGANRFLFLGTSATVDGELVPPEPSGKNLYKVKTVTYTPGQQGVPPTPGSPARSVYETRQVCKFVPVASLPGAGGGGIDLGGPGGGSGGGGGLSGGYIWICAPENVLVTYPAVPPSAGTPHVEPSTNIDYHLGWNAGARSNAFFMDDGYGQFQVRASVVGVVCGLNSADATDARYAGTNIDYAFSLARGLARIVENGAVVATLGAYADATVFKIARNGTDIVYSVDGTPVRTKAGGVTTPLWLEAAMYAGDDEVFAPSIVQSSPLDLTEQTGTISAALPPMGIFAAAEPFAELRASLPAMSSALEAGLSAPAFAVGNFVLPPLYSTTTSLTGGIGQVDGTLPALDVLAADHAYAELRGVLPAPRGVMYAVEGNENASMGANASAASSFATLVLLGVEMSSTGVLSSAFLADTLVPAEMLSTAELGASYSFTSILEAAMQSFGFSGGVFAVPGSGDETWAFNLDSGGSTNYKNFGFNSYARIGDRFYGANDQGVTELDGETDNGAPIRAVLGLGLRDFGTSTKKTLSSAYIGMSAKGNLFVKVVAESKEYVYKTRDFSALMQQQRVTFGKGLRTNYVWLDIYNENGLDFEIDSVEFVLADMTRKI